MLTQSRGRKRLIEDVDETDHDTIEQKKAKKDVFKSPLGVGGVFNPPAAV